MIFFLPGIIGTYGQMSMFTIGLLTSLPWIAAAIGAATLPRFANTPGRSRAMLIGGYVVMATGLLIAAFSGPVIALLGFCIAASMFFVVQSIIFMYPSSRLKGAALAGGLAFVNSCGLLGGFVGPSVMGWIEQSTGASTNGLIFMAALLAVAAFASMALRQGQESERTTASTRTARQSA